MTTERKEAANSSSDVTRRTTCRACGGTDLHLFLDLGKLPLANSFLTAAQLQQPEPKFPLEVFFCKSCTLVQLLHVVNPEVLFSHYLYRSGTSSTLAQHNEKLCESVCAELKLTPKDLVVEIAGNDGSLLSWFKKKGIRTLGVEPAQNIAKIARETGIETLNEFFDAGVSERVVAQYGEASAVIGNNVLAHVDQTVAFLTAARKMLKPGGRVIIEVPYLGEMLDKLEYDTIYHEHLCYFSVTALMRVFAEAGMHLDRVELVAIHGGSLRLWGKHKGEEVASGPSAPLGTSEWRVASGKTQETTGDEEHELGRPERLSGHGATTLEFAEREKRAGMAGFARYQEFARLVQRQREQLLALFDKLKKEGKTLAAYGAPAKGNTLLCYCSVGTELVPYTVDASPLKVGLYCPGSHLPTSPTQRIFDEQPDYVLILAWNFAPEIMKFLQPYKEKGGHFILPIPEPRIL